MSTGSESIRSDRYGSSNGLLLFVERGVAQTALTRMHSGLQMQFVGDSQILIDMLLGHSCTKDAGIRRYVKLVWHNGMTQYIEWWYGKLVWHVCSF